MEPRLWTWDLAGRVTGGPEETANAPIRDHGEVVVLPPKAGTNLESRVVLIGGGPSGDRSGGDQPRAQRPRPARCRVVTKGTEESWDMTGRQGRDQSRHSCPSRSKRTGGVHSDKGTRRSEGRPAYRGSVATELEMNGDRHQLQFGLDVTPGTAKVSGQSQPSGSRLGPQANRDCSETLKVRDEVRVFGEATSPQPDERLPWKGRRLGRKRRFGKR